MAKKNSKTVDPRIDILNNTVSSINQRFGNGSIVSFSEPPLDIPRIPSGLPSLDYVLGGGWPRGRIVEIFGPESSGKSSLCLHALAEAQKMGGIVAFVDVEHALDPVYAQNLGVDLSEGKFYLSQPDSGNDALEITESLVRSSVIDIVVVDSVAALVPKAELEGEMGDSFVGLQARLMSQAMRKLTGAVKQSNCVLMFTNQTRQKIGVMYGNPETTTGGKALPFYASIRLRISGSKQLKDTKTGEITGRNSKVETKKNKTAPPFRSTEIEINFGTGMNLYADMLDLAVQFDLIEKAGAFYTIDGQKFQGKENGKNGIKELPEDRKNSLYQAILNNLNGITDLSVSGEG